MLSVELHAFPLKVFTLLVACLSRQAKGNMRLVHLAALVFLAGSALAKPIAPNAIHKRQLAESSVPGMTPTSIDAPTTTTDDSSATCTALYTLEEDEDEDEYCGDLADRFDIWLWDDEYEFEPDSAECEDVLRQYRICKTEPLMDAPATPTADAITSAEPSQSVAATITLININGTANGTASNTAEAAPCTCESPAPSSNATSPWNVLASLNGTISLANGTGATNATAVVHNCTQLANASSITLTLLETRTLSYMRTLSYEHGTADATSLKTILVTHTDEDIIEVPAPTPDADQLAEAANLTGPAANVTSTPLRASSTGLPVEHIRIRNRNDNPRPDGTGAPNDLQGISDGPAVPGSAASLPAGAIESSAAFLATPKPTVPMIPSATPSPSQSPISSDPLPSTTDEATLEAESEGSLDEAFDAAFGAGSAESSEESVEAPSEVESEEPLEESVEAPSEVESEEPSEDSLSSEESASSQISSSTSSALPSPTPLFTPTVDATLEKTGPALLLATDALWAVTKSETVPAFSTSTAPCNVAEGPWPCVLSSPAATSSDSTTGTSTSSSTSSTPTAPGTAYKAYYGSGAVSEGWPEQSSWVDFETMFEANRPQMKTSCAPWGVENNTDEEVSQLKAAILSTSAESSVDARFILAVVMQESTGCVRVITTQYSHLNPGLMQSHNGIGSCNPNRAATGIPGVANTGSVQSPCPESMIIQMVRDGTMGTPSGDGLQQMFQKQQQLLKRQSGIGTVPAVGVEQYYRVARMYNGGSIAPSGKLEDGCCTRSYASDIANRLLGWTTSARVFT